MQTNIIKFAAGDKWLVMDLYRFCHALNILCNRLYVFPLHIKRGFNDLQNSLLYSLYYIKEGDELRIDRISMESPAEFNLKGADGIVKQLREFIKDIKYRNKIEEKMLQTELMRQQVSLMKEAGYTDEEIKEIIGMFFPPANKIKKQMDKNDVKLIEDKQEKKSNK